MRINKNIVTEKLKFEAIKAISCYLYFHWKKLVKL